MNERIYNLARQAEQQAREHVRDCEYYGYTMIEGTAEDEFHAEFRDRFAKLIVQECVNVLHKNDLYTKQDSEVFCKHFGVEE